jgi:hypothetical protein
VKLTANNLSIERVLGRARGSLFRGDKVVKHRVRDLVARVRIVLDTMDDPVVRTPIWRFIQSNVIDSFGRRGRKKGNYWGKSVENDRKSWR